VKAAQINDRQQFQDVMEQHTEVNSRLREVIIKLSKYEPEVLNLLDSDLLRSNPATVRVQKHLDGLGDSEEEDNDDNEEQDDGSGSKGTGAGAGTGKGDGSQLSISSSGDGRSEHGRGPKHHGAVTGVGAGNPLYPP
jgi:hypothetical protein